MYLNDRRLSLVSLIACFIISQGWILSNAFSVSVAIMIFLLQFCLWIQGNQLFASDLYSHYLSFVYNFYKGKWFIFLSFEFCVMLKGSHSSIISRNLTHFPNILMFLLFIFTFLSLFYLGQNIRSGTGFFSLWLTAVPV